MFLLRAMMLVLTLLCATEVYPCTNILYKYKDQYLVGRNFDWLNNDTDVVFNPIGKKRETAQLAKNEKPLIWRSQYGSVTFVMTTPKGKLIPTAVQGGMNQKGLVVSLLEFSKAKFQKPSKTIPNINNTYLTQYWLDTCQSVAQAIKALNHLNVVTTWWYGNAVPIHYVLRDAKGNSAVVEYIDGKKHVFEGKSLPFRVLTNTQFSKSNKLLDQYHYVSSASESSESYHSAARYVRAIAFLKRMPEPTSNIQSIGYGFAALQNVAEPPGSTWPTVWSVVYNTQSLKMYYRTLSDPRIRAIDLHKLSFKQQRVFPIKAHKPILEHGNLLLD